MTVIPVLENQRQDAEFENYLWRTYPQNNKSSGLGVETRVLALSVSSPGTHASHPWHMTKHGGTHTLTPAFGRRRQRSRRPGQSLVIQ